MSKFTPIHIEDVDVSGDIILNDNNGGYFCMADTDEKAEFIINACNSHDKLVEALGELLNALDNVRINADRAENGDRVFEAEENATQVLAEAKE